MITGDIKYREGCVNPAMNFGCGLFFFLILPCRNIRNTKVSMTPCLPTRTSLFR